MCPITAEIICGLPRLKIIHSQGVAYNLFDLRAARNAGVYVSNCAGVNAAAVAEQAVMLILVLLRNFRENEDMVYAARQGQAKTRYFENGLRELGECHVGIIGLGAIGKELAKILKAFGCKLSYFSRTPVPESGIAYLPLDELYAQCDIISLHVPVKPETIGMIDETAIGRMKRGAIIINTARGELVDQEAVCRALKDGRLGGAGFDTLAPEPVRPDNPFLALPQDIRRKVALSPHIGGITAGCFHRCFNMIWHNLRKVAAGERPMNIVNGL
jgi:phosphoglycerate dehydrogenase-like enzyme